jgi:putative phage-type endonuclease
MLQRSKDWYEARRGRFTASEIHKLLGIQGLGETGKTYAFEKAVEAVYGLEEETFTSFDMQRGIDLEPFAFRKFQDIKAMDFIDVQECTFFPYGEHAGASPDGLVGIDECLEIKCPKRNQLLKIVANGISEVAKPYIPQMQMQMMCTNSKRCHFFCYGIFEGREMWHTLIVEADLVMQNLIKTRIDEAVAIKQNYIELLIKNQQF